ncbi:N-acetyltransferase [Sessilibacter corallicola]|uniref:N-acetyltransferase domain-containing protein n=1 Tax=Sessilibacter corallicola TaxID=2904075 RepID=A0ABQ0A8U9_9GAMM
MNSLTYVNLDQIPTRELIALLNSQRVRKHLVSHDLFDETSISAWVADKCREDSKIKCIVRAIKVDHEFAGWCAIQPLDDQYEIALVLGEHYWGIGITVFKDMVAWGIELGHETLIFNLMSSRPKYKFLNEIATNISECEIMNHAFTQYEIKLRNIKI